MFFDTPRQAERFNAACIEIARLQKRLLLLRFDAVQRAPRPLETRRKGLLGREPVLPAGYEQTLARLHAARQELQERRRAAGYTDGGGWWEQPWERLGPVLMQLLTLPPEEDEADDSGWRHTAALRSVPGRAGNCLLCLHVHAHKQAHSGRKYRRDIEHSAYTPAEREALVGAFNDRRNAAAAFHMFALNNVGVDSLLTGQSYRTAVDYYASPEYLAARMYQSSRYSESLYTVEEQRVLSVSSNSADRRSVHAVCEYRIDEAGTLQSLAPLEFAELQADGGGRGAADHLQMRDAGVLAALWLAEERSLRRVPLALFAAGYDADDFVQAVRVAGILTCLADKLTGGDGNGNLA